MTKNKNFINKAKDAVTAAYLASQRNKPRELRYNQEGDYYEGGTPFQVTVTGTNRHKPKYQWATARTPQLTFGDAMKGVDVATGPLLHWMQPSQYVGAVRDAVNGKNPFTSMFRGNSGVVSEEYAAEHPVLSTVFNLGTDAAIPTVLWAKNTTPVRNYRLSRALKSQIAKTTPSTTVQHSMIDLSGLVKGINAVDAKNVYSNLSQLAKIKDGSKAYFMRAPRDVDVLKLGNGSFRHEVVGNEILPSGEVNGKFVSYGEPWMEFGVGENSALYEFPIGARRGPSLMATDWKGRPQKYSVDEIYDYMRKEGKLTYEYRKAVKDLGLDKLKGAERVKAYQKLKKERFPELLNPYNTSIYKANQTVIPNERWNFDRFLKTPFWQYTEDANTGQVQRKLFMPNPTKNNNVSTIGWDDAKAVTPKIITDDNAASITPKQWTAAQDAAIARGDMAEVQRLTNLHATINDYHFGFYHETLNDFNSFNRPGRNSYGDLLSPFGVFTKSSDKPIGLGGYQMPLIVRYKNPLHVESKKELFDMLPKDLQEEIKTLYKYQFDNNNQQLWDNRAYLAKQRINKFLEDNNYDALQIDKDWAGTGLTEDERWTDATVVGHPGSVKSPDAITYDDNGDIIPLGDRHNFKINDKRYSWLLPMIGLGIGAKAMNNK